MPDQPWPNSPVRALRPVERELRRLVREFFELEPGELDNLIAAVNSYNEACLPKKAEAERLADEQNDDRMLEAVDVEQDLYRRLLEVRETRDALGFECERLETELKLAIGTAAKVREGDS